MRTEIRSGMTEEPVSISADVSIGDAREIMRSWGMRHLPVIENDKLVGVLSDRDILQALSTQTSVKTEARKVMSKSPYRVNQHVSVATVAQVMAENKFGCAIVTDDQEKIVGIFTTVDALHLLARILAQPTELDIKAMQIREYLKQRSRAS